MDPKNRPTFERLLEIFDELNEKYNKEDKEILTKLEEKGESIYNNANTNK